MTILCIETSTSICSAAICIDGMLAEQCICNEGSNHARLLPRYIEQLLQSAKKNHWAIDAVAVSEALAQWQAQHEGECISVLVNNAGVRKDNLLMWMPAEDWHRVLRVSLDGFYNVTQPLLKVMLRARWGRIVNVVSLSGIKGLPGQTNYSAAKGGVIAATKALAQEVAKKRVTVNAVAPGFIRTDMTADLDEATLKKQIPSGRFGEADEVAALVAFLCSDEAGYITGEVISINGGLYT